MKKVIVAILAFVYITTSTGIAINMHYCMGELVEWSIGQNKSKICGKCGMAESNNGCCKDEYKYAKNDADQKTANGSLQITKLAAMALPATFLEIPPHNFPAITIEYPVIYQPPRSSGVAVCVRNCFFLI